MLPISYRTIWSAFCNAWDARDRATGYVLGQAASTSMAPSATGAGSLGVTIAAGNYTKNGAMVSTSYAGGSVTLTAAHATLARVDIVFMSSGGTLTATAGTPLAIVVGVSGPVPPVWPAGCCPLAICLVPPGATDFTGDGYVSDVRPFSNSVRAISKAGSTALTDLVTLTGGSNVTLTQSGQDISIASSGASGGTPALTLGTANTAGVASTFIRTDDTILTYDATVPAAVGTASAGNTATAARRNHVHPTGAGTPSTIAYANATGSGPAAAMTDHVHAVALTYSNVALSGSVTMTNSGTVYDGPSAGSLAAGTWLVMANVSFALAGGTNGYAAGRIWDGSTSYASVETQTGTNGIAQMLSMSTVIVLGSPTTIKFSAVSNAAGLAIQAATPDNGVGNNASQIVAIRIV